MEGLNVYDVNMGPPHSHPIVTSRFLASDIVDAHRLASTWLLRVGIISWVPSDVRECLNGRDRQQDCAVNGHVSAPYCMNCGAMNARPPQPRKVTAPAQSCVKPVTTPTMIPAPVVPPVPLIPPSPTRFEYMYHAASMRHR